MADILKEFQPYLTAATALFSATALGFILNLVRGVRDNAHDRIATLDERLKLAADKQTWTEEKAQSDIIALKEQIQQKQSQLASLLESQGLNLTTLTLGNNLSNSASAVRETAELLVKEMQDKIAKLAQIGDSIDHPPDPELELNLAMGAMANGSYADAAGHFDAYSKINDKSWQVSFSKGVAHANARRGSESDLASLRAYNDAIALAPPKLDPNLRARMFTYRGAMLKRLNRFPEAESDFFLALKLATASNEIDDLHYNLACIYAMQNQKDELLAELKLLRGSQKYRQAVSARKKTYFINFADDPDFIAALTS